MRARAGQNISLWLHAEKDSSFSISQDSQFSVLFLSVANSIYGAGAQLMLSESNSQNIKDATGWKKILYWKTSRPGSAPGVFKLGIKVIPNT